MSTPIKKAQRLIVDTPLPIPGQTQAKTMAQEMAIKKHFEERIKGMERCFMEDTFPWDEIDASIELWWSFPDYHHPYGDNLSPDRKATEKDGGRYGVLTVDACLQIAGPLIGQKFYQAREHLSALQQNIDAENKVKKDYIRHIRTLTPDTTLPPTGWNGSPDFLATKCQELKARARRELRSILGNPDTSLKRSLTEAYVRAFVSKLEVILELKDSNPMLMLAALKDLLKDNQRFHKTPLGIFQECDRDSLHRELKKLLCDIAVFIENQYELTLDLGDASDVRPAIALLIPEDDPEERTILQSLSSTGRGLLYQNVHSLSKKENLVTKALYDELEPLGVNIKIKSSLALAQSLNETSVEAMEEFETILRGERGFPDFLKHFFASKNNDAHAIKWLEIHGLKTEEEFKMALLAANTPAKKSAVLNVGKAYFSNEALSTKNKDFLLLLLPHLTDEQLEAKTFIKTSINLTKDDGKSIFLSYLKQKLGEKSMTAKNFAKFCVSFSPEINQALKNPKFSEAFNQYLKLAFERTTTYDADLKRITANQGFLGTLFISAIPRNSKNMNQTIEDFLEAVGSYDTNAVDLHDPLPKLVDPNDLRNELIQYNQRRGNILHEDRQTKLFESHQFKGCLNLREDSLHRAFTKQQQTLGRRKPKGDMTRVHPEGQEAEMRKELAERRSAKVHPDATPKRPSTS